MALLVATLASGCRPQIGDSCESSVNCSATGERLCDVTQPGGYCTVFNCEPGSCPDGSACVAFGASLAKYPECQDVDGLSRFERTFCVSNCDETDDCRSGYVCEDLTRRGAERNAIIVDTSRSAKVCLVAVDPASSATPAHETGVCTGTHPESSGSMSESTDGAESSSEASPGSSEPVGGAAG